MKTFISILRGINVSGKNKILMADLKALYESLGFIKVQTYIQSGNVIFNTEKKCTDVALAEKIQKAILDTYEFKVPVIIRTMKELKNILKINPFLKSKEINAEKLHVTFLSALPDEKNLENIRGFDYPPDEFKIIDKEIFLYCPVNYGETKLSNKFFESKLKLTATTRNWKTVNKLAEMAE